MQLNSTLLNIEQAVVILLTGGKILVQDPYDNAYGQVSGISSFSFFNLSMLEGRDAMSSEEIAHYLLQYKTIEL